jgi:nitrogen regulatory protein PII
MIVSSVELPKITRELDTANAPGYTIIRQVSGKGFRGMSFEDDAMNSIANAYVIVFCPPEQTRALVEAIKPILNKFGGHCFVSEVQEISSVRCIATL